VDADPDFSPYLSCLTSKHPAPTHVFLNEEYARKCKCEIRVIL
jgi:hypothetical protein